MFIFLKLIITGVFFRIHFFLRNSNNYFLHNIQFYFIYLYRTQDHLVRSTFLLSSGISILDYFKYFYFTFLENILIYKILTFFRIYTSRRKRHPRRARVAFASKFIIFARFLVYLDMTFDSLRSPYFFFRKEAYLDKILALGRVSSSYEYVSLVYFAFEKEFYLFSEELLVGLLNFKRFFFFSSNNYFGKQLPILMLDYSILSFIYENKKKKDSIIYSNSVNYISGLKNYIYLFLLNNYFIYLFFFNYFNKFFKLEVYIKFFSFYFFNLGIYLYLFFIYKDKLNLCLFFIKYLKYTYMYLYGLNLLLSIFFQKFILGNFFIIFFYNVFKKSINLFIIIIMIYFFFNLAFFDLFSFFNSLLVYSSLLQFFLYFYSFFFELLKYFIEIIFFKSIILFFSTLFLNILNETFSIASFDILIDYKILFLT